MMQLTPLCLMLSCLRVRPDRAQFFRYTSISLTCEDQANATGWKVKRKTPEAGVRSCSSGWGTTSTGSSCVIGSSYPTDTGLYWCESDDGEQSNAVNITITDRPVLLETPAHPVAPGSDVTVNCKAEMLSSKHTFDFFRDGRHIGSSSTGEMVVRSVSKADEGLYQCKIPGYGESSGNWMTVDGSPEEEASLASAPCSVSVSRMLCHLAVGTPYLLSTVLLGLIYRDRNRAARTVAERRGSSDVVMEIVV